MTKQKTKKKRRRKGRYKKGIHTSPKAGACSYRSGWELSYMRWLDDNPDVVKYGYETVVIEYVSNMKSNRRRKYYPDFLVEYAAHKELIEIKPSKRLVQANVKKKLAAAKGWCDAAGITLKVLTEHELKQILKLYVTS